jgi:glycosyltransferase involved in cell wall biosynthesis
MEKSVTCCLFTSSHAAYDDRIFHKEALSLQKAGYRVVVIVRGQNVPAESNGVSLVGYRLPSFPRRLGLGRLICLIALVRLGFRADADVYHCHTPDLLLSAVLIQLAQRVLRRKRVFIIHEIRDFYLHEAYLDRNLTRRQRFGLALRECWDRFLERRCDHIVGVEETKVARPLSYGIPRDRVTVVENYVQPEVFVARPKRFDPNRFVVAYEGGLSNYRGIDKLAEACVTLAARCGVRVTLLLAGRWNSSDEAKRFEDYCAQNRDSLDLRSLGWIPHVEIPRMLTEADVCCTVFFSKRYERVLSGKAGPIKLYEYMACGKPIIASDLPALRYVVEKARCGVLVDRAGGAQAIADALEHYYRNPGSLAEHGANGRRAVEQWFHWPIAERKLLDVYAALLARRGPRPRQDGDDHR